MSKDDFELQAKKAAVYWVAVNYQQNYYEVAGDWNKYESSELLYLKNYIGHSLYGPPVDEDCIDKHGAYLYKEKNATDLINKIFDKIKEHGTQIADDSILCTVIYCCMYSEDTISDKDMSEPEELVFIRPVFKVYKNEKSGQTINCVSWFIDTECRVYKTWDDYLVNTNLPKCVLIAPKDGEYRANLKETWSETESCVWVEKFLKSGHTVTKVLDYSSAFVGLGTAGVMLAAPFIPVIGATTLAVCGIAGAVSALWSGGRSVGELIDRKTHDQNLIAKAAIPAWLGAAGSALGGVSSGGSFLLSRAVRTGTTVSRSARYAHDIFAIGNIAVNVAGASYSGYSIFKNYRENNEVSITDVVYLSAHIFFVCNSVMNMRLANTIIQSDQKAFLQEYEASLRSKRHQKEFRRLVRNTAPDTINEVHKNEQIIKSLNNIGNKDEFYACLTQNRKLLAQSGSNISFKDGNLKINEHILLNPTEFAEMSKDSIRSLLQSSASTPNTASNSNASKTPLLTKNAMKGGFKIVRDFCVQKSIPMSESQSQRYTGILYDLRNHPNSSQIISKVLETGLEITKLYAEGKAVKEIKEIILPKVTGFLWQYIKSMMNKWAPGILKIVYENEFVANKIWDFVKMTCDDIMNRLPEITKYFAEYQYKKSKMNLDMDLDVDFDSLVKTVHKSSDLRLICDVDLISFSNLMELPEEEILGYIFETLDFTCSSLAKKFITANKDVKQLCTTELREFFDKHPTKRNFEDFDSLAEELGPVLDDLRSFNKKDVIFYKLIVMGNNISPKIRDQSELDKSTFVDVLRSVWLVVLLTLRENMPGLTLEDKNSEHWIISIIIRIYWHYTGNPEYWTDVYQQYKKYF